MKDNSKKQMSAFFVKRTSGKYPEGVTINSAGRFASQIRILGNPLYMGTFDTAEEAHKVFVTFKEDYAQYWYNKICAGEVVASDSLKEAFRVYKYS